MWLIGVNVLYFLIKFSKSHADDADAAIGTAMCSCASEVDIAVGAVIVVVCLLFMAIINLVIYFIWWGNKINTNNMPRIQN